MKSPFPGMDPYLEKYWHEVHEGLIIYTRDTLRSLLPPPLKARIGERVVSRVELDSLTEGYIDIVESPSDTHVLTTVEFLSPQYKFPAECRDEYCRKQSDIKRAGGNLVEIDLTRAGRWTMAIPRGEVPPSHRTTYRICTLRAGNPGHFELYRAPLLSRLPSIRVPLRPTDEDVLLDLQPLVDRCYEMGDYDDFDYRADPDPPLDAEDAKLADEWLRGNGLR